MHSETKSKGIIGIVSHPIHIWLLLGFITSPHFTFPRWWYCSIHSDGLDIADEKESLNPVTETAVEKQKNQDVNLLQEEGELSPKHEDILNNGHKTEPVQLERSANQRPVSDGSNYSRFLLNSRFLLFVSFLHCFPFSYELFWVHIPAVASWTHTYVTNRSPTPERPRNSPRGNLSRNPDKTFGSPGMKYGERNRTMRSRSPVRSPVRKAPDPSASNHGQTSSRSLSPNGTPKRVRKGRGFTEQYSFVRRYRTPSPERPRNYGGRNIYGRSRNG